MLAKTPDQIKNIVEDWIKTVGKPYQDITQKQNDPNLAFVFEIGNLIIFMLNARQDRITLQTHIGFAPEHQQTTANLNDTVLLKFMIDIIEPILLAHLSCAFDQDKQNPKQINNITINGWIDTDSLNRMDFYKVWDGITSFRELTIKKVQVQFGVKGVLKMPSTNTTQTPSYLQ